MAPTRPLLIIARVSRTSASRTSASRTHVSGLTQLMLISMLMLALPASGCRVPGGVPGGPGPALCAFTGDGLPDGAPPATPTTLALTIGTDDPSGTHVGVAWKDGDHVPMVSGGQGGFMIRPAFDVTAAAPLTEDGAHTTCLVVTMLAAAPATMPSLMVGARARRVGGPAGTAPGAATYHVPALLGLLSYDRGVEGANVRLTFYLHAPADAGASAQDGYAQLTVVPDATLAP